MKVSEGLDWSTKPVVGQVQAQDADEGLNSVLYYSSILIYTIHVNIIHYQFTIIKFSLYT